MTEYAKITATTEITKIALITKMVVLSDNLSYSDMDAGNVYFGPWNQCILIYIYIFFFNVT